jgi:hypothetical protein
MKRILLVFALIMIWLSACMAPSTNTLPGPTGAVSPVVPSDTAPAATPTEEVSNPKLPASSFEAETYINETVGFALEYPAGWTVNEVMTGDRGTQVQFLSSPELADLGTLPEGETRLSATVYQWDPENDLAAFVENQKNAWDASGFTILEEQQLVLELGLPAVQHTVQTPEANVIFLTTAIGDHYLVVSGEGNLELVKEIVQRVRPISP